MSTLAQTNSTTIVRFEFPGGKKELGVKHPQDSDRPSKGVDENIDGRSSNRSEQQSDSCGQRHCERPPEGDAYCAHGYSCAACACGQPA